MLSIANNPNLLQELKVIPTVTLEVPALSGVFATDRAVVRVHGASEALAIEAELTSVVEASELTQVAADVVARDASYVMLAGTGPELTVAAADMAHVEASRLTAERVTVTIDEGAPSVTVCTSGAPPGIVGEAERVTVACE
ncbi:GIN domain-containing protein [Nannocystis pusilla]|uniref:GIN domain-containing protein n=1 Tax=Nannocystis pusilla TaxID=889268 RepID=UPI003B7828D4